MSRNNLVIIITEGACDSTDEVVCSGMERVVLGAQVQKANVEQGGGYFLRRIGALNGMCIVVFHTALRDMNTLDTTSHSVYQSGTNRLTCTMRSRSTEEKKRYHRIGTS
jgi:hypothetical protein